MSEMPTTKASLGLLVRLIHQHWSLAMEAELAQAGFQGIRPPHANVFTFVPPEGIQVSKLTLLARVRKQSMAQAVDELERLGYVERRPDPNDKRARLVFLTPQGQAVRPFTMLTGHQIEAHWAQLYGSQELNALRDRLQSLLDALQTST